MNSNSFSLILFVMSTDLYWNTAYVLMGTVAWPAAQKYQSSDRMVKIPQERVLVNRRED
jgi:hypothetical protein